MLAAALLACAINVAPTTMDAIVRVESGGNLLAIHVNHLQGRQPTAATVPEAASIIRHYMAAGYTVDIGYSQLNSANLLRLNYSVEDALDRCKNIAGGGAILSGFYGKAVQQFGEGQRALMAALSAYNTGDLQRGFANGYVGKYYIHAPLPSSLAPALPVRFATPTPFAPIQVYTRPGLDLHASN
jgi:type IV secretion system protein VirB1